MTSLLTRYKALPDLAGPSFLPIAFLARLPSSMIQLGTVLLVATGYDSIAAGGLAAASLAVGAAVGGPTIGALADRTGQRTIMLIASLVNATAALALVAMVLLTAPLPTVYGVAVLAGASAPQIGPLMRARWVSITGGGPRLGTAMSYEGAADETTYVLGPAAVSLLAAVASPALAMIVAAVLVGIFGTWTAIHPTARIMPAAAQPTRGRGRPIWTRPRALGLMVSAAGIGCFFGAMQTGVTAVATERGSPGAAGALYALMGIGSAITGLACASLPNRFTLADRLWVFAAALAALVAPLLLLTGLPSIMAAIALLGLAVGPYLVTLYSLGEQAAPPRRTGAMLTLLASGTVVGYAVGSGLGGSLAQAGSAASSFAVALLAAITSLGVGVALRLR